MSNSALRNCVSLALALILISPLFSLPRPTNVSSIPWRVELLFGLFLAVLAFVLLQKQTDDSVVNRLATNRTASQIVLLMSVFAIWSVGTSIWAASSTSAIHHSLLWANYVVIFVLGYFFSGRARGRSQMIWLFAAVAVFLGGLAAFDFVTIQDFKVQEGTLRIRYAKFAEMLVTITPVFFAAAILAKSRSKTAGALMIGSLAWIGVMLSLSKGAFLAGGIGIVFCLALITIFKPGTRRRSLSVATAWLILTVAFQVGFSTLTSIPSTAEYLSGKHQTGPSTSDMRIYTWKIAAEMIRSNIVQGVGGDNFGLSVNETRRGMAKADPNDPDSAIGEDYIFERTHNEPLQIFAELGIVGIVIFAGFVIVTAFGLLREIRDRSSKISTLLCGALGGLLAFGVSSLFSSFSFRAFQNGIMFFLVLGFAVARLKRDQHASSSQLSAISNLNVGFKVAALALPILLAIFSLTKAGSQYILLNGERSKSLDTAISSFNTAAAIDPDNPGAELAAAEAYVREKQWASAVPHFRRSIDRGFGVSLVYSYMANAQEMSGDFATAESTLREAASIFPRSAFIRARLAFVLENQNRYEEANQQLEIGRTYSLPQINGWFSVIKDGILNAHLNATRDPLNYDAPPELKPQNAIHFYNHDKVRID